MRVIEGHLAHGRGRYGIVVSRFNDLVTERLLEGALDVLRRHGVDLDEQVTVVRVPGSFEVPLACARLARRGGFDALVALACVIRGGTPHFDYVAAEIAKGVASVALQSGLPVAFGVLTTDTIEQALERAGTKMGNKGAEAALAALEMVGLLEALED